MPVTYIDVSQNVQGLASDKTDAALTSAIGATFFEEDTGILYRLTRSRVWEPIALISAGDLTIGRVKVTDGTDVLSITSKSQAETIRGSSGAMTTGQVSVANTATLIVAANTNRTRVTLTNLGTTDVFLGASNVTTTTGDLIVGIKGAKMVIYADDAIYGIVSVSTQTVSYIEETI